LTEDWIRQHTGGESAEANHWLSDDPGDSEHSSLSGSISGDHHEQDPRTPTLKRFLESREKEKTRHSKRAAKRQPSTETLKQEHFEDKARPSMSDTMGNAASAGEREPPFESPSDERPPPPPPKEEWNSASLPAPGVSFAPAPSPAPGPPRLKKKVPWKGKNIMVLLPWDDERGQKGKAPTPMTEKDVEAMLAKWEEQGYDTKGFNLGHTENTSGDADKGQSCSVWPQAQDLIEERQERSFRVSIPDRRGKLQETFSWKKNSPEGLRLHSHASLRSGILPLASSDETYIYDISLFAPNIYTPFIVIFNLPYYTY
jgi:hypothetical protein